MEGKERVTPPAGPAPPRGQFELLLDFAKGISWPFFAFVALSMVASPLRETVARLPSLLDRSDKLTISGVTVELEKRLSAKPSAEVERAIGQLSPDGLQQLLSFGGDSATWDNADAGKASTADLVSLGLLREMSPTELKGLKGSSPFGTMITPLGKRTRSFLMEVIKEFASQLSVKSH